MSLKQGANITDKLVQVGILCSEKEPTLTDEFATAMAQYRDEFAKGERCIDDRLEDINSNEIPFETLERFSEDDVAIYFAVVDWADIRGAEALKTVVALRQILTEPAPIEGVPREFVPIRASVLPTVFAVYNVCLVYIWRQDCPPCDQMQETFNKLFSEPPSDLLLVAVYGPDDATMLQENYDVRGGPATLFVRNGTIKSRLLGAHYSEGIKSELASIQS